MNETLEAALEYAARGWRVFPVTVTANGRKKRVRPAHDRLGSGSNRDRQGSAHRVVRP